MSNNFSLGFNINLNDPKVEEVINIISNHPEKNKMTQEQLFELFKNEMNKKYGPNIQDNNDVINHNIEYLFNRIIDNNLFGLINPLNNSEFWVSQRSFWPSEGLPRQEGDLYLDNDDNNNNYSSQNNVINLIFDDDGTRRNIPFPPDTTIKDALHVFFDKFKSGKYIENYDFYSGPQRIDVNSEEKIGKKFTNNTLITVNEVNGLIAGYK